MAGKKMVNLRTKIREILSLAKNEKGGFYLAMLAQSSPDLTAEWTLVVSSPWTEAAGLKYTVRYFSARMEKSLTKAELASIDRIAVLDGREPMVQTIQQRTNQHLGGPDQREYQISNAVLGGVPISEAFVFEADPHPDSRRGNINHSRKTAEAALR
jgi:hypothetical protein